jgi:hypothetical protein
LAVFREMFCEPAEVAHTLCVVPVFDNEEDQDIWCIENYNSTACTEIRDSVQEDMERFMLLYYYANAAWGLCLILLVRTVVVCLLFGVFFPLVGG